MEKLADVDNVSPALIEGGQNTLAKMRRQLSGYLLKALEYEEKEAICGEHRIRITRPIMTQRPRV